MHLDLHPPLTTTHSTAQVQIQMLSNCLSCVPVAQGSNNGWACTQYCNDPAYVSNVDEASDCSSCIVSAPQDVSSCRSCMTASADLLSRQMCFACVKGGLGGTDCVQCASVVDVVMRTDCFKCIAEPNATAWGCLYGTRAPLSPPLSIERPPAWRNPPLPPARRLQH